jgi:predicted small lipoprotein YifL
MASLPMIQIIPALAAMCALTACGMRAPQDTESKDKVSAVGQSQASKFVGEWVTAPRKHNNSGIELRYKLGSLAKVGQPMAVQLDFFGVVTDDAQVQLRLDPALRPVATDGFQKSGNGFMLPLSKSPVNSQVITVTPSTEGMHFIQLQMTQAGRTSATSIAIRVGDGPVATPTLGTVQTMPGGEKIIVMPAAK